MVLAETHAGREAAFRFVTEAETVARPEMVPLSQKKSRWIWRTPVW
jgi:hypothetical protein